MGRTRPTTGAGRVRHGLALLFALSAAAIAVLFLLIPVGLATYLLRILTGPDEDQDPVPVRPEAAPPVEPEPAPALDALTADALAAGALAADALVDRAAELETANAELTEANARLETALTFKN